MVEDAPLTVAAVIQVGSVSIPDILQASYRTQHRHLGWSCRQIDPGSLVPFPRPRYTRFVWTAAEENPDLSLRLVVLSHLLAPVPDCGHSWESRLVSVNDTVEHKVLEFDSLLDMAELVAVV